MPSADTGLTVSSRASVRASGAGPAQAIAAAWQAPAVKLLGENQPLDLPSNADLQTDTITTTKQTAAD